jgi:hypothetical protein
MTRNSAGNVSCGTLKFSVPNDRSALSILGVNQITDGGDYRNDGYVYVGGKRVKRWCSRFDGVRIWEPHLNDLMLMHRVWKRAKNRNDKANEQIWTIVELIRRTGKKIAHCEPVNYRENKTQWWQYRIDSVNGVPGLGFDWIDKPKKLVNHRLGQQLYSRDRYWYHTTAKHYLRVNMLFIEAMRRALPKPQEHLVRCFQFGDDHFWWHVEMLRGSYPVWKLLDMSSKVEFIKII